MLPKSKLLDKVTVSSIQPSEDSAKNKRLLPPANKEYYKRKPLIPLQWSRPHGFSGFLLDDHSLVLIGTCKYNSILQQSFQNYLQGSKEDVDDFVTRELSHYKGKSAKLSSKAQASIMIDSSTSSIKLDSKPCHREQPTPIEFPADCRSVPGEIFSVDAISTEQPDTDQPMGYYYISSSSDEELPRVQVTGMSAMSKKKCRSSEDSSSTSIEPKVAIDIHKHVHTTEDRTALPISLLRTDVPSQCPICGTTFTPRFSQYEADEHIANCLSISINDFEDDF